MSDRKTEGRRSPMLNHSSTVRKRPQLSPEVQAKIGQQLRKIYDDMVSQGVPDRFVDLLDCLDSKVEGADRDKSGEKPNDHKRRDKPNHKHRNKESR